MDPSILGTPPHRTHPSDYAYCTWEGSYPQSPHIRRKNSPNQQVTARRRRHFRQRSSWNTWLLLPNTPGDGHKPARHTRAPTKGSGSVWHGQAQALRLRAQQGRDALPKPPPSADGALEATSSRPAHGRAPLQAFPEVTASQRTAFSATPTRRTLPHAPASDRLWPEVAHHDAAGCQPTPTPPSVDEQTQFSSSSKRFSKSILTSSTGKSRAHESSSRERWLACLRMRS